MNKNQPNRSGRPKVAYRQPTGNYPTKRGSVSNGRRITITAVYKDPPDYKLLSRALLQLAQEQAKKQALRKR